MVADKFLQLSSKIVDSCTHSIHLLDEAHVNSPVFFQPGFLGLPVINLLDEDFMKLLGRVGWIF